MQLLAELGMHRAGIMSKLPLVGRTTNNLQQEPGHDNQTV
jgi:hypothetical protein